jgi:hypothetical protein
MKKFMLSLLSSPTYAARVDQKIDFSKIDPKALPVMSAKSASELMKNMVIEAQIEEAKNIVLEAQIEKAKKMALEAERVKAKKHAHRHIHSNVSMETIKEEDIE